jgi:hypothetical protein
VFLYDLTTRKRLTVYPNGSNFRVLVPNSGSEKTCYLTSQSQFGSITSLQPVTPTAQFTDYTAVNFDSAFIIVSEKSLMPQAQQYASYRGSMNGGSHNVVVADIDELYDQFAYGIRKHPLSIRRFARFALDTAVSAPPRYLFLIGKGISTETMRNSPAYFAQCLVPSMGYPATDNYFTAGLTGNMLVPGIPTGRLAARNPQEVSDYLNKVQVYESTPASEWMKHIIHFGGGSDPNEQMFIRNCLDNYKTIIENPSYGGKVHSFFKDNSQPIQLTISDSVRQLINNGVSLMTFFGHASGSSFDQNIDYAANYSNYGKFPLILANSCFTGDIHQPSGNSQSSTSEEWVMAPNKGAIAFIASISKTSSVSLCNYSSTFYNHLSLLSYNKSVGYCMQQSIAANQNPGDPLTNQACLEMSLHGDPSLRINTHTLPDYAISDSSIFFSPGAVSTGLDSFDVNIVITNLGKAQNDSLYVELNRVFPNLSTAVYTKSILNVWYRDTLTFRMPVDKINGPGLNKFEVKLDPLYSIPELDENNNNVQNPSFAYLLISSGDVLPVYPYNYAIVPYDTVTLKASTGDPFAPASDYEFEIDTTDLYNSPLRLGTVLANVPGGVMSWKPPLTLLDTAVYYWHVRKKPSDSRNSGWKEFSFQYVPGKRGWEQAHFFQFKNDNLTYLDFNRNQRTFDFITTGKTLTCDVYGQALPQYNVTQLYACEYKLDLTIQDYAGCGLTPAIHVVIIDPVTLSTWKTRDTLDNGSGDTINPTHVYGNINDFVNRCDNNRTRADEYFIFRPTSAAQLQGMRTLLRDSVPNGYHILMYTWLQGKFQSWADSSVRDYIRDSLGASNISSLADTISWIYYCVKGDTSTGIELFSDSADQFLRLTKNLSNNSSFGTIVSELLGPARTWDSLSWYQRPLNNNANGDSTTLDIIGIDTSGTESVVRGSLPVDSANIYLGSISAGTYPYLKLRANLHDPVLLTSPQLRKWQVFYTPSPEVAVDPPVYFSFQSDTVQEGDSIRFKVAVTNVSEFNMDSMLVTYWIVDKNRVTHYLPAYMTDTLAAGASLTTSVKFSSYGFPGLNSVWMEINPLNRPQSRKEQFHFNNLAQVGFFVGTDRINPLLDVTFDGIHILNGDIVSARPDILVQVKDENKFLALNDTADFKVYIKSPSMQVAQRIYFANNPQLTFTPAILPSNSCRINYTPSFLQDGVYEMIVQAQDRSANQSGSIDYRITFEVINRSTITEVMNYPNPFSTSTRFVFTLTGSELPEYFKIQVFTITGKVIREIDKDELGPLHIGRNITEYAWDGKDEFGDQLANGVYFYRVQTRLGGSSIEHRETEADQYFKKGFGKMYLMR